MCIALAILAASPVLAHAGRYELIPEPDVRQSFPQPGGGVSWSFEPEMSGEERQALEAGAADLRKTAN
jgi:hypothetical protein